MGLQTSRQELISSELSEPAARDWLCTSLALRDATKVLAASIHKRISHMHRDIRHSVGSMETCTVNCSQSCEDVTAWCRTCTSWKEEIFAICTPHFKEKIVWSRFWSCEWPSNPYEVGRVFIPRAHHLYYRTNEFHEDICYSLYFMENCTIINASHILIQRAWLLRNSFKRRGRMRAKKKDLQQALSVLIELLTVPQISEHEAVGAVVRKLVYLQHSSDESVCVIS